MKSRTILLSLVLGIFILSCKSNFNLEKDGGVRVILAFDYPGFLKSFAPHLDSFDEHKQVLLEIKNEQVNNFSDFMNSYQKTWEKNYPEGKLASMFTTVELKDKTSFQSSNEEVIKVLREEGAKIQPLIINIIRTRLDRIGATNATINTDSNNNLIIEVPGQYSPERIQTILLSPGNLSFWHTLDNNEILPVFNEINRYLADNKYLQKLNDIRVQEEQNRPKIDSSILEIPLFSLLQPSINEDGTIKGGAVIGVAQKKDTAQINSIFKIDSVLALIPRNCRFLWSREIRNNENAFFEMFAVRGGRNDEPDFSGKYVVSAKPKTMKTGNEISLEMNSEGAHILDRISWDNIGRQIVIALDNVVWAQPYINNRIENGKAVITGHFTPVEVKDISAIINGGQYPAKLTLVKSEKIEPVK